MQARPADWCGGNSRGLASHAAGLRPLLKLGGKVTGGKQRYLSGVNLLFNREAAAPGLVLADCRVCGRDGMAIVSPRGLDLRSPNIFVSCPPSPPGSSARQWRMSGWREARRRTHRRSSRGHELKLPFQGLG